MSKQFCPFMSIPGPTEHISKAPCMREECALWLKDPLGGGCCFQIAADWIAGLIRGKMGVQTPRDRRKDAVF